MLKIRMFMALSTIVLSFSVNTYAQFSRQQAIDTVINHIVAADTGNINVYIAEQNFPLGQPILTYSGDSIVCMYSNNFVFFVDDNPISNCQPECRYIIISSETGNYTIVYQNLFPKYLMTDYELLSGFPSIAPNPLNGNTEIILPTPTPNANLYAVLIAGKIENEIQGIRYSNDMALVYNTLLEKGYSKENIIVHYGHGIGTNLSYGDDFDGPLEESDDIDYPSYKEDIDATFSYLSSTLDANDLLFIYVTDHGGISWLDNWHQYIELAHPSLNESPLWDYEFAGYLGNITCSQVVVVMQQCYSGGFLNELQNIATNFNLTFYTAGHTAEIQGISGETWSEEWLTGSHYCEFTFYWCAAVRGVYPIVDRPWEPLCVTGTRDFKGSDLLSWHTDDYDPDENGDFYISMDEAFNYANFMNTWNLDGQNYHPYLSGTFETPMFYGYYADIQTLAGFAGIKSGDIELSTYAGMILIGGKLETNTNILVNEDKVLYFSNEEASLISNSLIIDNSVQFLATSANNQIVVNNLLQLGQNILFTSEGPDWNVYLNGAGMQTVIADATFEKCILHNYGSSLTISNSTFDDCVQLSSHSGNVDISDCDFNDTWLNLEDLSANQYSADVTGCNFTNGSAIVAIDIWDYDNFNVVSNTIDGFICEFRFISLVLANGEIN